MHPPQPVLREGEDSGPHIGEAEAVTEAYATYLVYFLSLDGSGDRAPLPAVSADLQKWFDWNVPRSVKERARITKHSVRVLQADWADVRIQGEWAQISGTIVTESDATQPMPASNIAGLGGDIGDRLPTEDMVARVAFKTTHEVGPVTLRFEGGRWTVYSALGSGSEPATFDVRLLS